MVTELAHQSDHVARWQPSLDDVLAAIGFTAAQRVLIVACYAEEYRKRFRLHEHTGQDFDATMEAESALSDAISRLPNAELPVAYSNGSLQIKFMKRILH